MSSPPVQSEFSYVVHVGAGAASDKEPSQNAESTMLWVVHDVHVKKDIGIPTFNLCFCMIHLLLLAVASASPEMYGLKRVANSASCSGALSGCSQLVSVEPSTGVLSQIGVGHQALAALGDLVVIEGHSRTYYFLGGGWNSTLTFLVGLSLDTGEERCNIELPSIGEYGIVGGGQSLSLDSAGNRLIITGLAAADGPHVVLTADLGGRGPSISNSDSVSCGLGPFEKLGTFPYSGSVPAAHSSELDAAGTTLYTNLVTDTHTYGIGVVDVAPLKAAGDSSNSMNATSKSLLKKVIPMDNGVRSMWGMSWHNASNTLVSVQHNAREGSARNGDLDWRTLDPIASPEALWSSTPLGNPAFNATLNYTAVWGNLGSVRAYDHSHSSAGLLYVLVAVDRQEKIHIGAVNASTGALVAASPQISEGGKLLWSGNGLLQIAVASTLN